MAVITASTTAFQKLLDFQKSSDQHLMSIKNLLDSSNQDKQTETLKKLEMLASKDALIQATQLLEQARLDKETQDEMKTFISVEDTLKQSVEELVSLRESIVSSISSMKQSLDETLANLVIAKPANEEAMNEAQRAQDKTLELLSTIARNTIPTIPEIKPKEKEQQPKGIFDGLKESIMGALGITGAKTLGGAAMGMGKKALGFLGGGAGKVLGPMAAIADAAYQTYGVFDKTNKELEAGTITQREATVKKGGGVGKGVGVLGGTLAGGKVGAMIGSAILPGVGTAVGGILGGILGGFATSDFGQKAGEMVTDGALKLKDGFDEYVVKPMSEMFNNLSIAFQENIVDPIKTFVKDVGDFFTNLKTKVVTFVENFGIPEISYTIPVIGKTVSIGPFYPFKPGNSTTAESAPTEVAPNKTIATTSSTSVFTQITKEEQAYKKLDFVDKLKVDAGISKASDVISTYPSEKTGADNVGSASKQIDALKEQSTTGAFTSVNAPTVNNTVSTTQVAKVSAPVRIAEPSIDMYRHSRSAY